MRTFVTILALAAFTFSADRAYADLYKYRTKSGEVIITTEKRSDLELIEVVASTSSKTSKKSKGATSSSSTVAAADSTHRQTVKTLPREQREAAFDDIIREASSAYDVPFAFIKAVMRVESSFNANALSHAGAMGLMQLMPRTAASLNVTNAFDPRQNIFGGAKFLRILTDRYDGDINLILAAYNAGDAAVARYDGIPYPKTRGYVASVFRWYQHYSAQADE